MSCAGLLLLALSRPKKEGQESKTSCRQQQRSAQPHPTGRQHGSGKQECSRQPDKDPSPICLHVRRHLLHPPFCEVWRAHGRDVQSGWRKATDYFNHVDLPRECFAVVRDPLLMLARQFLQVFQFTIVGDLFPFPVIHGVHNAKDGKTNQYRDGVHMFAHEPARKRVGNRTDVPRLPNVFACLGCCDA